MNNESNPYYDFSEDESLIAEYDPGLISDVILQIHGREIQKHLKLKNPTTSIRGLISYLILAVETSSTLWPDMARAINHIRLLLLVNTAALLYVAYALFQG